MNFAKFLSTAFLFNTSRSSRFQMVFKIGVLKSFPNLTGKHLCSCLFLKSLQAEGRNFIKRSLQHRHFPVKFTKLLRTHFLQNTSRDYFCTSGDCFCTFFKKVTKQLLLFRNLVMDVLIIFSSRHIVWCIKSQTLFFINLSPNLSSIVRFSK